MAAQTAAAMPEQGRRWALSVMVFLVIGAAIAWSTSVVALTRFYGSEGTLLRFDNVGVPHPVTSPCFWGAVGFVVALAWSGSLYARIRRANPVGGYQMLGWFLVGCVLFGWSVVGYESWRLNHSDTGSIIGCLASPMTSIFQSPCLYGSSMYLAALVAAYLVVRKSRAA
jgi:hypothetical protein